MAATGKHFDTTQWSLLHRVRSNDSRVAGQALEQICQGYWLPLFAWLRSSGNPPEAAEDMTQGFFAHAIKSELFTKADPGKGRLRSFLLAALKRYLANRQDYQNAQKRGGGRAPLSLDFIDSGLAERQLAEALQAPVEDSALFYDRSWGRTLVQRAMRRLGQEHANKEKTDLFETLGPLLSHHQPGKSYAEAAARLNLSEETVRVAFHRFKNRFGQIVREELAQTLLPGDDLEEELAYLTKVLSQ